MADRRAVDDAMERALGLEEELEISGTATSEGTSLAFARAALLKWVDSVVGVVAAPGAGRVTLIHANGSRSQIASPELPYQVTMPINFAREAGK
ncbi:MAG: hypothetical protein KGK11_12015 [Sphingomonadales bacterium]|nr:hypothetical protein [Sphingomonadales bacterium]